MVKNNIGTEVLLKGTRVTLRNVTDEDLPQYYQLIHGEADPEWKKWDAPYFPLEHESFYEFCSYVEKRVQAQGTPSLLLIEADGQVIGTVSYYWEHKESNWLEMGIGIYRPEYWSGGYGTEALKLWIDFLFESMPLARVGLTTWSGNHRMMRCAEKLGLQLEGRMRKCRIYNGEYYDSIRMGILREEWELLKE
ncbi:GNAT family N-acetyltransferase [Bacillus horti]|uniref:RimJ/RimL family protein N-acetyltransferase n=1 Tax=Caldalkalibacillus horti TaxID=77523 RepID=A0ABT9W5E4_9BACI|nr:GNAT family protein [Bacillus horti]MDQ0168350.1 RimJ/RimL family protein N-acetyltransferase [Bacillus horti]